MYKRLILSLVAAMCICAGTPAVAAQAAGPSLFRSTADASSTQTKRYAISALQAVPDLAVLPQLAADAHDLAEPPRFTLDLPERPAAQAQVVRAESTAGGVAIIARLVDTEQSSVVLVQNGNAISGSVTLPGATYSILPGADGSVTVTKVAPELLPPDGEPKQVPGVAPLSGDAAEPDVPTDTGKLIDVIVFWTPAAQAAAGGLSQIQSNIDLAITLTNNAYRNSGIAQRVRLVNKQSVAYTENTSGSGAFDNALTAITNGTITGTATARNTYGADEVVLVIEDNQYCGLAWLPGSISSGNSGLGFAVVGGGSCLTSNFSFGHELGHNMGAHHDPYVAPGPGAFAYSHGYSYIGASSASSWRTIMAYNNQCAATVGGCARLQYFSNPLVNYTDGHAMGDGPARNNALTLNKSANAVSNYRATTQAITASFSDVPLGDPFFGYIEFMYQAGYTGGCATGPLRYCPADAITRGQMAVFLERSKRGALFSRTPTGNVFTDVSAVTAFAGFIEQLYIDGITDGCAAGPAFCPTANVNRAAMAKFLLKAKCGAAYVPSTPPNSPFSDVANNDPFLPWINKLYTLGITTGCATGPLRYCPADPVTRGAMATFIYRSFPYGTPSEACST